MKMIDNNQHNPVQGIFFDGQIYDAYAFVADLVRRAGRRIVLIDNYIDDTVLTMLSKREAGVEAVIYTAKISKQLTTGHRQAQCTVPTGRGPDFFKGT